MTSKTTGSKTSTSDTFSPVSSPDPEYEFGGPVGAVVTTLLLPLLTVSLTSAASAGHLPRPVPTRPGEILPFLSHLLFPVDVLSSLEWTKVASCACGLISWFALFVVLERTLPCIVATGAPLPGCPDVRLPYRLNAHFSFWVSMFVAVCAYPSGYLVILADTYTETAVAASVLSALFSVYLYARSFSSVQDASSCPKVLAHGGNTGNHAYDFFIGRELNPRWFSGTFDLKVFCELRPGLVGWFVLDLAAAARQHENLGYVSPSMALLLCFQGLYVWDAQFQERAILTTMDVTTDGFGFMLCFGDLAWVPATYSLQAVYLADHDPLLTALPLAGVLALHLLGYWIFRSANSQKDAFRRDPTAPGVAHLTFLETTRGTRLLTSGWWGSARKINYTGDWIMGLSWCALCGTDSAVPYFYAIYFAILLVHRSIRDDHMCQEKYGKDWDEYKRRVPSRFVPGVPWL